MKLLKTIVATAVIVFAMTSVAMAGVQQLTRAQDGQAIDKTRAKYRTTLTDERLARHVDHQSRSHVREAQRTKTRARRIDREHAQARQGAHEAEAKHADPVHKSAQTEQRDHSGSTGNPGAHQNETSRRTHVSSGGHDSGHSGGHGGD